MYAKQSRAKLLITGICIVLSTAAFSWGADEVETPPKAECTKATHGQFWPAATNGDQALLQKAASSGQLWQCEAAFLSYKWKALTIAVPKQHPKAQVASNADHKADSGQ